MSEAKDPIRQAVEFAICAGRKNQSGQTNYIHYCYHTIDEEIYAEIKQEGKIDILGNLDFEIVKRIDNKKERIAKLKGNRIILQLDAIVLPENILRYIVAHEIVHVENKRHTKKFWKTVELICPDLREAQQQLKSLGINFKEH